MYDLASYLASGMTEAQILEEFPYLEKDDFRAVYEFFAAAIQTGCRSLKLLVDENLWPALAAKIADLFPGSVHVREADLSSTADIEIWEYAKVNGLANSN